MFSSIEKQTLNGMMEIPELSKESVGRSSRKQKRDLPLLAKKLHIYSWFTPVGKHRKHLSNHTGLICVKTCVMVV